MERIEQYFNQLKKSLRKYNIQSFQTSPTYKFTHGKKSIILEIPDDLLITSAQKLPAIILSKLNLNKTVFARICEVKKIESESAYAFTNSYHIMNSVNSAYKYGIFLNDELLAVALFSKGRKMNRLPAHKKSYELMRFCTKEGITVTGGLSKLVKTFCREKNAGDVMTYIDKQLSNGEAYKKAGFIVHSETGEMNYQIHKENYKRSLQKDETNTLLHYTVKGPGSIKLIYSCNEAI
ncbi:MAG: hypothetical protein IPM51_01945 [Sphingobacteriaceae bacterium]|nr:hypothetical protein [Sphingobacteriaceae bacterium]